MADTKESFYVSPDTVSEYVTRQIIKQWLVFAFIVILFGSIGSFALLEADNGFPIWGYGLIVSIILVGSFILSTRLQKKQLLQFSGARYAIDAETISQTTTDGKTRQFKLNEIAIVDRRYGGLVIVKGNGWTKFNYLRPSRTARRYPLDADTVIFIPPITIGFDSLRTTIKQLAVNAFQF